MRKISLHGLIWVSVTVACVGLMLGAGWSVWKARERAYADAMVTTENLAGVLKQHSERIVDSIHMMLKVVARELGLAATDPDRQSATDAMLAQLTKGLPQVVSVRMLDGADGRTLYEFSRSPASFTHADDEALAAHVADPSGGLYVSRPFQAAEGGEWVVAVSMRVSGREGEPGNVVVAHLSLSALSRFYDSLTIGSAGSITLARIDGIILVRRPNGPLATGQDISAATLFREMLGRSSAGHFETTAALDGVPRIFSYRRLKDLPLVVTVGVAVQDVVAAWTFEARRDAGLTIAVILILVIAGRLLSREVRRRDEAELALAQSERRLRFALQSGGMVAWEIDPETRSIARSSNSLDIVGLSSGPAEEFLETVHPEDRARVQAAIDRAVAGDPLRIQYRHIRPDGSVGWLETRAEKISQQEGRRSVSGVTFNVTERRRIEEDLRIAKEAAERAQAQAEGGSRAKTEFLAAMSHEIRTPLNSIMGFTDLLLDRADLPSDIRRQIGLIRTSGSALLTVVNDVLDFSKIEAGAVTLDPQPLSPAALVDDCLSIMRELAHGRGLALTSSIDPAVGGCVLGDQPRVRQILLNLLNNAVKFTQAGRVDISADVVTDQAACSWLRFQVTDTGIGIAQDKQGLLFQRFSQVDGSYARQYGGTGLGLAICRQLVSLMGGEIGVVSEAGQGSTFWFTIPHMPSDRLREASHRPVAVPDRTGRQWRILLVEDVEINREIAEAMLASEGHDVHVALNGAEAVRAVQANPYDLVLMDVQMPVMDGMTATRRIRQLDGSPGQVPIVAMTANVYAEQVAGFLSAGMDGLLGKPFNRADLMATVARWAGQRTGTALSPAA